MPDPFPDPRGSGSAPLTRRQLREAERQGRRTPGAGVPQVRSTRPSATAVEPLTPEPWDAPATGAPRPEAPRSEAPWRTGVPRPTSSPFSGPVPTRSFEQPFPDPARPPAREVPRETPPTYEPQAYEPQAYEPQAWEPRSYEPGDGHSGRGYDPLGLQSRGYDARGYDTRGRDGRGTEPEEYQGPQDRLGPAVESPGSGNRTIDVRGYDAPQGYEEARGHEFTRTYETREHDGPELDGPEHDGPEHDGPEGDGRGPGSREYQAREYRARGYGTPAQEDPDATRPFAPVPADGPAPAGLGRGRAADQDSGAPFPGPAVDDGARTPTATRRSRRAAEPEPEPEPLVATGRGWTGPVVAGLLLLWALMPFVPLAHPVPVLLAASAPLAAVVGIPLGLLSLRGHRWITAALATVAALMPWAMIAGYASPGPAAAIAAPAVQVRVMTLNAHLGRADPQGIVDQVRNQAADVVVITELTNTLAHDLTAAGISTLAEPRYVELDTGDGAGGIGVFSRYDLNDVQPLEGTRWPAVTGSLQTPGGPVRIVAGHVSQPLPAGSDEWASDLRTLAAVPDDVSGREILVGDLNSTPWNKPYRSLLGAGWSDAADVLGHGMRPTWPQWFPLPLAPLDHVMVRGEVGVRAVDTLSVAGSDHRGLVVTLDVAQRTTTGADAEPAA